MQRSNRQAAKSGATKARENDSEPDLISEAELKKMFKRLGPVILQAAWDSFDTPPNLRQFINRAEALEKVVAEKRGGEA